MTNDTPPLLEFAAERLRTGLLATLLAEGGDAASTAPKMVQAGAGPQHVMLQTTLEDFAFDNGFSEFHDFDELLPDVLAVSPVAAFVGEASTEPLLRPGMLDTRQRIETFINEFARVALGSWFDYAMVAVCVSTHRAAEQWLIELIHLTAEAAVVVRTPFYVNQQAEGVWITAGVICVQAIGNRGSVT